MSWFRILEILRSASGGSYYAQRTRNLDPHQRTCRKFKLGCLSASPLSLCTINPINGQVVYGDTDSVFVNSNVTELAEALKISAMLKKAVNDRYKLLEIDLDAIFQRLLLLQKKKYAAIKVEDGTRTTTEIKGLDMKRREYCALSKQVSQCVFFCFCFFACA